MDFLGIGPLELIVILVIAMIVVGPEKLPEIAQSIGKTVRQVRAVSSGFASEWQRELSSVTQDLQGEDLKKALLDPLMEASADVQKTLDAPSSSISMSTPAVSRTAPPGGFVGNPATAQPSESQGTIPSETSEPQELAEEVAGDTRPTPDQPSIAEEDTHAES